MKLLITSLLFALSFTVYSQEIKDPNNEPAQFPGGDMAMHEYIADNICYPKKAMKKNTQGVVFIEFTIDPSGRVVAPRVNIGLDPELDKIALEVVAAMPTWRPAKENGEYVKQKFMVEVRFKIENKDGKKKFHPMACVSK